MPPRKETKKSGFNIKDIKSEKLVEYLPIITYIILAVSILGLVIVSIVSIIQTVNILPGIGILLILSLIGLVVGFAFVIVNKFVLKR